MGFRFMKSHTRHVIGFDLRALAATAAGSVSSAWAKLKLSPMRRPTGKEEYALAHDNKNWEMLSVLSVLLVLEIWFFF